MRSNREPENSVTPVETTDRSDLRGATAHVPSAIQSGASAILPSEQSNLPRYEDIFGMENTPEALYEDITEYQPYSTTDEAHIYEDLPEVSRV